MIKPIFLLCVGACAAFVQNADATDSLVQSVERSIRHGETAPSDVVTKGQGVGRFLTSSDGTVFLYEWQHPYEWTPERSGLPPAVSDRPRTLMYKVDVTEEAPTSVLLFQPLPDATYYLGAVSPDDQYVSFYELSRDENKLTAGAVRIDNQSHPQFVWFREAPALIDLSQPASWVSSELVVYPVQHDPPLYVRENVISGESEFCKDCFVPASRREMLPAKTITPQSAAVAEWGFPKGAQVVARSQSGDLYVYCVNTPNELSILFKRGSAPFRYILRNTK